MAPFKFRRRGLAAQLFVVTSAGWGVAQTGPATPGPTMPVRVPVQQPTPGTVAQPKTDPAPTPAAPGAGQSTTQPSPGAATQPPPGAAQPPGIPTGSQGGGGQGGGLPTGSQGPTAPAGGGGLPTGSQGGATGNTPASTAGNSGAPSVQQSGGSGGTGQSGAGGGGAPPAPAGSTTSVVSGGGGAAGAAQNANTSADLLSRSTATTGVEVQRKNAVVGDPRVRGFRAGQYTTTADGGMFQPARLDLDTAITKFDPGSVRQIGVVKGPYAAVYGPGFSHLDLATLGSPRYTDGFEWHGRTAAGYQTNGNRWDLLQSVDAGDAMWGARITYNNATGNDYRAGDGTRVPGSFTSNTVNFAVGLNLTDKSSVELHGLATVQNNLEFPGLYFDVRQSNTDAYSIRYTLDDQGVFDRLTLDVWYNSTATGGDTRSGNKQAFVQKLLGVSFNPTLFPSAAGVAPVGNQLRLTDSLAALAGRPGVNLFTDESDTRFAGRSVGYRLATNWGPKEDPYVTLGTDLNAFGQGLTERIRIQQLAGQSLRNGLPIGAGGDPLLAQDQSIPQSNQVNPGLFVQAKAPLTTHWTVRSGGRVDWVRSSSGSRLVTGNFNLFGPIDSPNGFPQGRLANGVAPVGPSGLDPLVYSADRTDASLSRNDLLAAGFLSSEYKLDDNWTSTMSFGHAQRAPTLTELYAAGPFIGVLQQGTSRLIGDPNLHAEHLTQIDFGLRADYDFLTVGANAFYGWINNYITYDANRLSPGLTQVVYTNTDLATLAGTELFAQADVTDWLTPFGTLAYVQGVDQTAGDRRRADSLDSSRRDDPLVLRRKGGTEPLPQIAPLESRVGFRVHAPGKAPRWQVEFNARMVSGQTLVATSLGETTTPGFTVFNIRGFVKVTDNLLVSAGVDNLGDRTYREHLDPISGNTLGSGALLRPGTNFFFNTQLTY